jgi:hypothetical protein
MSVEIRILITTTRPQLLTSSRIANETFFFSLEVRAIVLKKCLTEVSTAAVIFIY